MNNEIRVFELSLIDEALSYGFLSAVIWQLEHSGVEEKEEHLLVYSSDHKLNKEDINASLKAFGLSNKVSISEKLIKNENWNENWESNFDPICIKDKVYIRADFHAPRPDMQELIIQPKMAFGTGHHETTRGMIELMMESDMKDKTVLDMGCGTGVLGIYALMCQADHVDFIDNDKWCYENTLENLKKNACEEQKVLLADRLKTKKSYDIILANIHKNVILGQLKDYEGHLSQNGEIITSGFYEKDKQIVLQKAEELGFYFDSERVINSWCVLKLKKY